MSVKIYHNPRCSKSRQALALIENSGIAPEVIKYLETPPTIGELTMLLNKMDLAPMEAMRKGEAVFKELDLKNKDLSAAELIQIMAENPILIERAIVVTEKGALIARPPERVSEIL